ncbi:rhomboid family intramembrane serine protease [Granulicella arctica]|uniref:Rhomboid protease GluP n=1 Tax=Granulicella arctica TaxID=940613 RepID=A0A7Y9TIT7_9BACT|nr:rhomboid family intramembrane serine protease [Granulicella arctica]NYF81370.1 rhomboid protease GluP [Granulicella arctica]
MPISEHQGEILPPIGGPVPVPEYPPAESHAEYAARSASRPQKSTFNPLSSPATYLLVGINCAVYLWMCLHGASFQSPSGEDLLRFGAMGTHEVLAGQWYRLLTATFVHIGIIHIGTNMWCLWNLGLLGEPLIGAYGLVAVYMLTGIAGNLLSLALNVLMSLHQGINPAFGPDSIGAGASGAVFGIAGILIVLLSNKKLPIPWTELKRLRRSVIQFAVLNLILGGATIFVDIIRIDNSAHIGGFLSGLALGVPLVPRMTSGRLRYLSRQKITFVAAAFLMALFGYWISKLS